MKRRSPYELLDTVLRDCRDSAARKQADRDCRIGAPLRMGMTMAVPAKQSAADSGEHETIKQLSSGANIYDWWDLV